ncbi:MAG: four-helix bundle copper-binding protein [bacterium]
MAGVFLGISTWSPAEAKDGEVTSHHVEAMLDAHPYRQTVEKYRDKLVAAIDETSLCSQTCTACADACVGEKDPMLAACIRLNTDCADICDTTGRLLSRLTETPMNVVRSQLQTCIVACLECTQECEKHAEQYGHCQICSDTCARCAQVCNDLLAAMQ